MPMRYSTTLPLFLLTLLGLAACEQPRAPAPPPPVPVVTLEVATEAVPVAVEEVGRAEASNSATLLPRVGGQILTRHFEEGQAVAAGDLLYSVDPATFEAKLRSAEAQLARTQAELKYAQDEADRYAALETKRTVSRSQAEQFTNAAMVLRQAIRAQEAEVEQARLNLEYCQVHSPIPGRAGCLPGQCRGLCGGLPDTAGGRQSDRSHPHRLRPAGGTLAGGAGGPQGGTPGGDGDGDGLG